MGRTKRWFHFPAGGDTAVITGSHSAHANQPLLAKVPLVIGSGMYLDWPLNRILSNFILPTAPVTVTGAGFTARGYDWKATRPKSLRCMQYTQERKLVFPL